MDEEKEVKVIMWHLLVRLENMKKWGGAHSELKRITKSLPSHLTTGPKGKSLIANGWKRPKEDVREERRLLARLDKVQIGPKNVVDF